MALLVLSGWVGPIDVAADQPMAVLRAKVTQGLAILNDPRYRSPEERAVQGALWRAECIPAQHSQRPAVPVP